MNSFTVLTCFKTNVLFYRAILVFVFYAWKLTNPQSSSVSHPPPNRWTTSPSKLTHLRLICMRKTYTPPPITSTVGECLNWTKPIGKGSRLPRPPHTLISLVFNAWNTLAAKYMCQCVRVSRSSSQRKEKHAKNRNAPIVFDLVRRKRLF